MSLSQPTIAPKRSAIPIKLLRSGSDLVRQPLIQSPQFEEFYASQSRDPAPNKKYITRIVPHEKTEEALLFDSAVLLKVNVGKFAMHLPDRMREKLFIQLNSILNIDAWDIEDTLPRADSFNDFLRWTIYSKCFEWSSIGVSDYGEFLISLRNSTGMMTATFLGNGAVRWTATVDQGEGKQIAAGKSDIKFFMKQINFYLSKDNGSVTY